MEAFVVFTVCCVNLWLEEEFFSNSVRVLQKDADICSIVASRNWTGLGYSTK